jgi:hypothetical protein
LAAAGELTIKHVVPDGIRLQQDWSYRLMFA